MPGESYVPVPLDPNNPVVLEGAPSAPEPAATPSMTIIEGPPGPPLERPTVEMDLDWRSVAWAMAALVVLVGATGLVRSAPRTITVLAIAVLLALALDPLVSRLETRPRLHRATAVALVMGGLVIVATATVALLAPPAVDQARDLSQDVDEVVAEIEELPVVGDDLERAGAAQKVQEWIERLPDRLKGEDTPLGDAVVRVADGLLVAAFTVLLTVALLLDGPRLVRGARRLVGARRRARADRIGRLAYATVGKYVAGSLLVATVAGLATLVAGLVLGVPLAPLVAVWVAVFDLVPQIGGAAGGIPFVLLGLTQGAGTALACAAFFVLYLQFENHLLSPLIVGRAVKLSPPATMTAALVGVSAGGVVGALLAVPLVAGDECGALGGGDAPVGAAHIQWERFALHDDGQHCRVAGHSPGGFGAQAAATLQAGGSSA
jgi:predicted PurR-regulated permease PerM